MRVFSTIVDLRKRAEMTRFLQDHRRYWTMNSWNRSSSYANCVKIHRLELTEEQLERAWDMLDMPEVYDSIQMLLSEWAAARNWRWQVGFITAVPVATWCCTRADSTARTPALHSVTHVAS